MRTVWLLVVVMLATASASLCAAEVSNKDIPLYDGKSGAEIGDVRVNPTDGAEMMWVPAGEFTMGTSDKDVEDVLKKHPQYEWFNEEKPQRKVYLGGYWVYKFETTVGQYRKFCTATDRKMPEAPVWGWKDDHPMLNVSWQDAADYAKWAGVSLPTEAQWEKAARGTDGRKYPWGNEWPPPAGSGNFADKSFAEKYPQEAARQTEIGLPPLTSYDDGYAETAPVGTFPGGVSPYGCMDMAGNVWEWCADWYSADYYKHAPVWNPKGPESSPQGRRVSRGGSWCYNFAGSYVRTAYRRGNDPPYSCNCCGFRCAKTP